MSIAILTQVYDEMRRLAIAGSVVARGDFRLKKLVPALEQAGSKAPVFAKVAEAVKAVVESEEATSGQALLELTTLVNAILYTQGETGAAGTLEPIETAALSTATTQTSARVLKPLFEALTTTGSGRLELIHDAFERGAFHDLRLVKPALKALDDGYPEIAGFIADKVLPLYGKAILPDLRSQFDMKGRGGHPRRLRLMHALDVGGSRDLVKQALDVGSKEVKVAAIECLGAESNDLSYLVEQTTAKAQEVRRAAYSALASMDLDTAAEVLQKALTGTEVDVAADSVRKSRNVKLLKFVIAEADREHDALLKLRDKTDVNAKIGRLLPLLGCLLYRDDAETEAFLLKAFDRRSELAKIKGNNTSGTDVNIAIVNVMEAGTKKLQATLAESHASLPTAHDLGASFRAARRALPPKQVFDMFAPYLTAKVDDKKKQRDPAWARREAILTSIADPFHYGHDSRQHKEPELDPRWLDVALDMKHLGLVRELVRPGHAKVNAFLTQTFNETYGKAREFHECQEVLAAMIQAGHPESLDAFVAVMEKFGKKADYFSYWLGSLVVRLPKSAIPRLESLIPNLHERVADTLLGYIQQLREKPST